MLSGVGMVSFADLLSENDVADVHNYLIAAAHQTWDEQNSADWWRTFLVWVSDVTAEFVVWVLSPSVS